MPVTITSPPAGAPVRGVVAISAAVTTDLAEGVHRAIAQVDGVRLLPTPDYTAPYEWLWNTDVLAEGDHTLRVDAYSRNIAGVDTLIGRVTQVVNVSRAVPPPVAEFSVSQHKATQTLLDASTSTGDALTYAWEIDGAPSALTDPMIFIVPKLGPHHVKLTVADSQGRGATAEQDIEVIWRGYPYTAQVMPYGQYADGYDPVGPWRSLNAMNDYSWQPQPDGSLLMEVHQGDHPSGGGGDRVNMGLGDSYSWQLAGAAGPLDINGQQPGAGPRFYRHDFLLPIDGNPPTFEGFSNLGEFHGKAPGASVLKFGFNGGGDTIWVSFAPLVMGVWQPRTTIDAHKVIRDAWESYIIEVLWRVDETGYVRVWRNGVLRTNTVGPRTADAEGRVFGQTKKTFTDGATEPTTFGVQMYREPAVVPPSRMFVRYSQIGASLAAASVD